MSTASSTIPMSCHYPVEVRQSQTLAAGSHLQLSSTTAAESLNFFQQISRVFTTSCRQGWDALETPLQPVATGGGSLFFISVIMDGVFLRFQMIYVFYSVTVHQRVNTVWLSPDTRNRASVERRAAPGHP